VQTDIFPGAWYGAGLPNRDYCVVYVPSYRLEYNGQGVPLPQDDALDKLDITVGKFGGMGRADGPPRVWEWNGHNWVSTEVPTGRFAYAPNGSIQDKAPAGIGFVKEDGTVVDRLHTYLPNQGVSNWIEWRGMIIGQAHDDSIGGAVIRDGAVLRRLDTGNVNEFRLHTSGDQFCLMYRKSDVGVVRHLGVEADFHRLQEITQVVNPPKKEDPPKVSEHPNYLLTVQAIRAKYPTPLAGTHAAFLAELALAIPGAGLLRKDGGTRITMPDGTTVAQDIIMFKEDSRIYDVLGDGENKATPTWGEANGSPADPARFYQVSGVITPPVEPPVEPPLNPILNEDQVRGWINEKFTEAIEQVRDSHNNISDFVQRQITDFSTRIAKLEEPRKKVEVETNRNWGHSHKVNV
jgi:hypothetical protein